MTFLISVSPLAAIGLVHGDMENALDCCVVGNISEITWRLHAPALVLLVLPQKLIILPDLSASVQGTEKNPIYFYGGPWLEVE